MVQFRNIRLGDYIATPGSSGIVVGWRLSVTEITLPTRGQPFDELQISREYGRAHFTLFDSYTRRVARLNKFPTIDDFIKEYAITVINNYDASKAPMMLPWQIPKAVCTKEGKIRATAGDCRMLQYNLALYLYYISKEQADASLYLMQSESQKWNNVPDSRNNELWLALGRGDAFTNHSVSVKDKIILCDSRVLHQMDLKHIVPAQEEREYVYKIYQNVVF